MLENREIKMRGLDVNVDENLSIWDSQRGVSLTNLYQISLIRARKKVPIAPPMAMYNESQGFVRSKIDFMLLFC